MFFIPVKKYKNLKILLTMKQRFYTLMMLALLFCGKAWADSDLYLFGKEVSSTSNWTYSTSNNLNNAITNGSVSYDASTKTVTFNSASATVTGNDRILYNKNVPGLKIVFTGDDSHLESHYCVFRLDVDTEILGSTATGLVRFYAFGSDSQCIYCPNETNLTIRDFAKMCMFSESWRAIHTKATNVYIYNSNIYMYGSDCAIQNDKGNPDEWHGHGSRFVLNDCLIRDSWGVSFGSVGELYDAGSFGIEVWLVHTSKAKSVMIIRDEDYIGVRLKGIALTKGWSLNYDTSNPSYGIEDYYTYDESTNTLTLKKDIEAKTGYSDKKKTEVKDWIGLYVGRSINIEGNGKVVTGQRGMYSNGNEVTLNNITLGGNGDEAVWVEGGILTLKDDIIIGGPERAINFDKDSYGNSVGKVIINPSFGKTVILVPCDKDFKAKDNFDEWPIDGDKAELKSCIITTPEGAEMRGGKPYLDGRYVKTRVVFTGITEYDLKIGDTQVTSVNASDILGDGGHFKYDASTNTLTVSNATFENTSGRCIYNKIDGLNVNFVGASTFTTSEDAIRSDKSINLIGSGNLTANVTNSYSCINLDSDESITCTINGPQLDLTSASIVIYDYNCTSTLNVTGSSTCLRLHPGEDRTAIYHLKALNLGSDLYISEPIGGYFNATYGCIKLDGEIYYGDVVIEQVPKKLGFSINGKEMTTADIDNVPGLLDGGAYIETGESNDPTLVLVNATLDWNDANAALDLNSGTNLKIRVYGDCLINAASHTGLSLSGNTTIVGGGTLRINSKWAAIETWDNTRFALQNNTTLIAHSSDYYGYIDSGMDYYGSWFIIEDGGLFAAFGAGEYNPISFNSDRQVHFDSYTDVRYPVGGQLWGNYVYGADGTPVTNDWAIIGWDTQQTDELIGELIGYYTERDFGFSIDGKEMTTLDMFDVPGLVSGNAFIETNASGAPTLVLNDATLEWNGTGYGLHNHDTGQDGLTIKVQGDCTIKVPNAVAALEIDVARMITIEGGGTLNIISGKYPIETYIASTLRIQDNTTVIAKSENGYSAVWDQDGANIEIRDGGVFIAYSKYEPIWLDSNGEFIFGEGIALRYPIGAYIGSGNNIYYADGTKVQGDWVVIGPDNQTTQDFITGVSSIKETEEGAAIYNLAGQKMSKPQKGIYIVGGKKMLIK